jgi:signal transduction histidine kinase
VILSLPNKARPVRVTIAAARGLRGELVEIRWLLVDQRPRRRRAVARRRRAAELESLVARRTSELEHTQRLKDKLVATVSHELRTPLAAIGGYAELLLMDLRGVLTEAQRTDVQRIQRACEHLSKIVDDLLDYSRLAAQDLAFDIHDTALDESLRGVMDLIAPQAREKRPSVELLVPPTIGLVRADPERLRQIVVNLVGNAIKFTPAGGTIYVRAFASNAEGIVEVKDTGPGIRSSDRDLIFEPFVRLRPDAATPGAGLGLSISRRMARAMEGDLTVQPGSNGGSCFALRLPLSTALAAVGRSVEPNAHA